MCAAQAVAESAEIANLGEVLKGVLALLRHGQVGLWEELRVIEEGAQFLAEGGMGAVEKRGKFGGNGRLGGGGQAVRAAGLRLGCIGGGLVVELWGDGFLV